MATSQIDFFQDGECSYTDSVMWHLPVGMYLVETIKNYENEGIIDSTISYLIISDSVVDFSLIPNRSVILLKQCEINDIKWTAYEKRDSVIYQLLQIGFSPDSTTISSGDFNRTMKYGPIVQNGDAIQRTICVLKKKFDIISFGIPKYVEVELDIKGCVLERIEKKTRYIFSDSGQLLQKSKAHIGRIYRSSGYASTSFIDHRKNKNGQTVLLRKGYHSSPDKEESVYTYTKGVLSQVSFNKIQQTFKLSVTKKLTKL